MKWDKYAENLQHFFLYFEVQESLIINKTKKSQRADALWDKYIRTN